MRYYASDDDGLEPTDFDSYVDYPAKTAKDLAVRFYVKVERDPERAARLDQRQNAAILELLQWVNENRAELRSQGGTPPDS